MKQVPVIVAADDDAGAGLVIEEPGDDPGGSLENPPQFCYISAAMDKEKKIFQVECPDCHSCLWVDSVSKSVVRSEKAKKKTGSLDDMLLKEKMRREEFERKFEATAEMQEERRKKAQEKFRKALKGADKDE